MSLISDMGFVERKEVTHVRGRWDGGRTAFSGVRVVRMVVE